MNPTNKWLLSSLAGATLVAAISTFEGTRYIGYYDVVGVLTVCNGYTGPDIVPGRVYTKQECDQLLRKEVSEHGLAVLRCTKVPLNQNQYDAYTSFTYNAGIGAYCKSTLVKKLNEGDYQGACDQLLRWDKAGGKVYRGLTLRRQAERELCLKPMKEAERVQIASS